MTIDKSQPT